MSSKRKGGKSSGGARKQQPAALGAAEPKPFKKSRVEKDLESALFGAPPARAKKAPPQLSSSSTSTSRTAPAPAWAVDRASDAAAAATAAPDADADATASAWRDDDDDKLEVSIASVNRLRKLRKTVGEDVVPAATFEDRLRDRFNTLRPAPAWAKVDDAAGAPKDSDAARIDKLLASTASVLEGKGADAGGRLPAHQLEVVRERDGNIAEPCRAVVQAVQFHGEGRLLMTAGFDKVVRFFDVDGEHNRKVAGVALPDMPVHCAAFASGGRGGAGPAANSVIISGRRPFFYAYDCAAGRLTKVPGVMGRAERSLERFALSPCGEWIAFTANDGYVVLLSGRTRQWVADFKMNGSARAVAFAPESTGGRGGGGPPALFSSGSDGEVYIWDARSRRCLTRFRNEGGGGTVTSSLAAAEAGGGGGGAGGYVAVGSESGVVNLYDSAACVRAAAGAAPAPLRALTSLTTTVDRLCFNSGGDAQILAMSSRRTKQALRLVHVASGTVFQNWPTASTPTHYPSALAFSPDSRLFVTGNDRGKALVYRLEHFS